MDTFPTLAAIAAEFVTTNFCGEDDDAQAIAEALVDRLLYRGVIIADGEGRLIAEDSEDAQIDALAA